MIDMIFYRPRNEWKLRKLKISMFEPPFRGSKESLKRVVRRGVGWSGGIEVSVLVRDRDFLKAGCGCACVRELL